MSDTKIVYYNIHLYILSANNFSWFDIRLELAGAFMVWVATVLSVLNRDSLSGSDVGFMILRALEVHVEHTHITYQNTIKMYNCNTHTCMIIEALIRIK